MKEAKIEREVEDIYNQQITFFFDNPTITHPFECDGLIDTKIDGRMLKLIMEYKYDRDFKSRTARAGVIVQALYYVKRFEQNGMILPNVVLVGDRNECFVFHVNDIISYLDESLDWSIAPSSAAEKNPDLVLRMANDDSLNPFVFEIGEKFDFTVVADKIKELATNVQRYVHVTEHNIATIFEYFKSRVVKDNKISANELVGVFLGVIKNDENVYVQPNRKNMLVAFGKGIQIDGMGFKSFAGYFNRKYTPTEKMRFDEIADRLIEDTSRRRSGDFWTPTLFCDYAHKMISEQLGEDWREKYVVWDNCCYDEQAEFLSETGWKRISDYNGVDKVLQYNEDGSANFVFPLKYIAKEYHDKWVSFQGSGLDMVVTKDHDLVVSKDYHDRDMSLFKIKAIDVYEKSLHCNNPHLKIPKTFSYDGNIDENEWILRLAIAINADGHYNPLLTHYGNSKRTGRNTRFTNNDTSIRDVYVVSVKKLRKVERMRFLLKQAEITYDEKIYGEYTAFKFSFPFNPKQFPVEWYHLSNKCKEILLDELFNWDGSVVKSRFSNGKNASRKTYSTSKKQDADFIEFLIASTGHGLYVHEDDRNSKINYRVSPTKNTNAKICNQTVSISLVDGGNMCYCFTVPSGMLVIRRNHKIYICGNCGSKNLTRDYKFKELYCSTLFDSELQIGSRYNPEATSFQFDFLNDYIPMPDEVFHDATKIPDGLLNALKNDKPIVFLLNPPYATGCNWNETSKAETNNTKIRKDMHNAGLGSGAENLQNQFMYRICKLKQVYNLSNVHVCLFSNPIYLTGGKQKAFLDFWCNNFKFENGCMFKASHFADVSDSWGITFNIWSNGETENRNEFIHNLIEEQECEIIKTGEKTLYNLNGLEKASDWVKESVKKLKTHDAPQLSSGLKVKDSGRGNWIENGLGYFTSVANNVCSNGSNVFLLSSCASIAHGSTIIHTNFTRCTSFFSARRLIDNTWINHNDEYMKPNTEHEKWSEFESDSVIFSLFESKSNQSSLRKIEYKGNVYDIKNEFFWMSKSDIMRLAEENSNDFAYDDARTSDERFVYTWLQNHKLSTEAKAVLDKAIEMVKKSFKYRELFAEDNPNYQINNWDAGFYQLKALWKQYLPDDFSEFKELYKALADKMRPMVYELGFLRK